MDTVSDLNATACGFPKLYQRDNLVSQEVVLQIEKETASAATVCSTGSLFPELDSISVAASVIQTCCPGTKAPDLEEDDKFYEDFNMDEVDSNIENYEETFGVALNDPEQLFGNDGIGSLFGVKDMSGADLNHRGTYAAEGSSIGLVRSMQLAISNPASADSVISSKTDPNLCFAMQAHSSISFFGLGVESSAADHQDWCFSNGSHGKAASIVS
ncbi:hypothetical protein ACSBR1_017948 [Camellia fascicularis]